MRTWWLVLLALVGLAGVWGQGKETLALTVHNDNGDPGEARSIWTKQYFVDDLGRLKRVHTVTKGAFEGDPDLVSDSAFRWEANALTWSWKEGDRTVDYEISRTEQGFRFLEVSRHATNRATNYSFESRFVFTEATTVTWQDENYRHQWSATEGYSQKGLAAKKGSRTTALEWTTDRVKLLQTREGRLIEYLVLVKKAATLTGTYFGNYTEENDWVPTGTIVWSGRGLWSQDPWVRLAHSGYFLTGNGVPLWPSFVLEKSTAR